MAMGAEAAPLIKFLNLSPLAAPTGKFALPYESFSGLMGSTNVTLLTSGKHGKHGVDNVGTLHAGMMTMYALRELQPQASPFDLVLNAGTCGGFMSKGCEIGSVCIPEHAAFHDRRIVIPGTPFEVYGDGKVCNASDELANKIRSKFDYLGGGVTTGDSLDHTTEDMARMTCNGATVKDMEAAAISNVCEIAGVNHVHLKVVTDLIDGGRPSHEEFMENLGKAAESLQVNVGKVLDFLKSEKKGGTGSRD